MRIVEEDIGDHFVVIDSGARLIMDSCEEHPPYITMDTLNLCGDVRGDEHSYRSSESPCQAEIHVEWYKKKHQRDFLSYIN